MIWGISDGNFYGMVDALTLLFKNKWKIPS